MYIALIAAWKAREAGHTCQQFYKAKRSQKTTVAGDKTRHTPHCKFSGKNVYIYLVHYCSAACLSRKNVPSSRAPAALPESSRCCGYVCWCHQYDQSNITTTFPLPLSMLPRPYLTVPVPVAPLSQRPSAPLHFPYLYSPTDLSHSLISHCSSPTPSD